MKVCRGQMSWNRVNHTQTLVTENSPDEAEATTDMNSGRCKCIVACEKLLSFWLLLSGKCYLCFGLVLILVGLVLAVMLTYCDELYSRNACHTMRQLVLDKYQLLRQSLPFKSS